LSLKIIVEELKGFLFWYIAIQDLEIFLNVVLIKNCSAKNQQITVAWYLKDVIESM
jgi:hypothetical protein